MLILLDKQKDMPLIKIKNIKLTKDINCPLKTGKLYDKLFSTKGGVMPSTITMMPGHAGMGKTTVCIDVVQSIMKHSRNKKALFISIEMNEIHLAKYSKRLDFKDLDVFIFDSEESTKSQFLKIIDKGWDLVFIDSFQQLLNFLVIKDNMSSKEAELFVITAMDKCRLKDNDKKLNTAFICTMHMTKSGAFAGSSYIKYMIDAMLILDRDEENNHQSYMMFIKNRDGEVNVRLYYNITEKGIELKEDKYYRDIELTKTINQLQVDKVQNEQEFDNYFNN